MMYLALASPLLLFGLLLGMPRFERFMLGSERDLRAGDTRGSLAGPRAPRSPGGTVDPWS